MIAGKRLHEKRLHEILRRVVPSGQEEIGWDLIACVLTLGRFCAQESELSLAERWYEDTALDDLLGIPAAKFGVVERRLGRWMGRYPAAAAVFTVEVEYDSRRRACGLKIQERAERSEWAQLSHGAYLLRTNYTEADPVRLWRWYMQLTQAEAAFRSAKSDLHLHPVFHQKTRMGLNLPEMPKIVPEKSPENGPFVVVNPCKSRKPPP